MKKLIVLALGLMSFSVLAQDFTPYVRPNVVTFNSHATAYVRNHYARPIVCRGQMSSYTTSGFMYTQPMRSTYIRPGEVVSFRQYAPYPHVFRYTHAWTQCRWGAPHRTPRIPRVPRRH